MNVVHFIPRPPYRSRWERILGPTESAIESIWLEEFCAQATASGYAIIGKFSGPTRDPNGAVFVQPQKQIDDRRVDFYIRFCFHGATRELIVECDGHDYHERTKEQASRDKKRDRDLQALGFEVLRFTGADIHADVGGCADDAMRVIMDFQTAVFTRAVETQQRKEQ